MIPLHDVRKYWKENLINFWNTRREGKAAEEKKRHRKKSWIDWYFAIKLFIFFNHLVIGRAAKLLWGSWWVNRKKTKESKKTKKMRENWYKIKWSIKEHTGTIHSLIEWWKLFFMFCVKNMKAKKKWNYNKLNPENYVMYIFQLIRTIFASGMLWRRADDNPGIPWSRGC